MPKIDKISHISLKALCSLVLVKIISGLTPFLAQGHV
jgi:hypothetical protein